MGGLRATCAHSATSSPNLGETLLSRLPGRTPGERLRAFRLVKSQDWVGACRHVARNESG